MRVHVRMCMHTCVHPVNRGDLRGKFVGHARDVGKSVLESPEPHLFHQLSSLRLFSISKLFERLAAVLERVQCARLAPSCSSGR